MPADPRDRSGRRQEIRKTAFAVACAVVMLGGGVLWYGGARKQTPAPSAQACLSVDDRPVSPDAGMAWVPPGRLKMGSEQFRAEEAPVREVDVAGFWIATHDVTNAQFARFVRDTGYLTVAEQPEGDLGTLRGSVVFAPPREVRGAQDISRWWRVDGHATWRAPEGRGSDLRGREHHPVVHVAHEDAEAYAQWAGQALPAEAQWELAARGGREGEIFTWGNEPDDDAAPKANHWRGEFPMSNDGSNGYQGTSPVGCFPANAFGLYDMTGNVWQWTRSTWTADHTTGIAAPVSANATAAYVIKGGSFLCAPNFCMRYRPAARQPGDASSGAAHIGFRTVLVPPAGQQGLPKAP